MMEDVNKTKIWKLYEAGKTYNSNIGDGDYYENIDANIDFYHGKQWRNMSDDSESLPQPVINVLRRVTSYHIANLNTDDINVLFEPLEYNMNPEAYQVKDESGNIVENKPEEVQASDLVTAEVNNLMEKLNFKHRLRDVVTDAAITGDGCLHWYFDTTKKPYRGKLGKVEGEISVEIVDGQNIMFGNANNPDKEVQPYILVTGRDLVRDLKREAKRYGNNVNDIKPDSDYKYMAGKEGKNEVDAEDYKKALYVIKYERDVETGKILMSKATQSAVIFEDIDTGLDYYPICWLNWERQKNQYHGVSPITGLIPNQISINQMFAMIIYHQKMGAFPNRVIDGDRIPYISNEIGADIIVNGLEKGERVDALVHNLQPTNMSTQITRALEMIIQYTKEMLGMTDSAMGNINNPENTSAIISVQKSSIIPLQNVKANVDEFVEDCAKVMLDMIATYYGVRPIAVKQDKTRVLVEFDFKKLKGMWLGQKVEVGNTTQYSEIAQVQTLTNLLQTQAIDLRTFVERIPSNVFPKRDELLARLEQEANDNNQLQQEYELVAQFVETLPPEFQAQFQQLMAQQQKAA